MVSMPKKSPPSNKLYNNLSKIQKRTLRFTKMSLHFDDSRRSQKIGHRPAQSTHLPTKAYTTMRPVMASVPSTHTREIWLYQQTESATVVATHALYSEICLRYPKAEHIFLIQDNRPVHLHPTYWRHCYRRRRRFINPYPQVGRANFLRKSANLLSSRLRYYNSRLMPHGPTRLRSCGDGCGRRFYIYIGLLITGKHFSIESWRSCNSFVAVQSNSYDMSDYYPFNLLIFIRGAMLIKRWQLALIN